MTEIFKFIPLLGMSISFTFAFFLFQHYNAKKFPFLLAWAISMVLFGLGFFGESLGLISGWNQVSAKIYYFFGGILAVGYLSMGTIYLLKPQPAKWITSISLLIIMLLWIPIMALKMKENPLMIVVILLIYLLTIIGTFFYSTSKSVLSTLIVTTILAAVGLMGHNIDISILNKTQSWRNVMTLPLRSGAFALSSTGTFIIIIGAIYSAITGWKDEKRRPQIYNTIIIAVGVLIAALGGTLHGILDIGKQVGLSLSTTIGIGVMLVGYLRTTKNRG